MISKKKLATAIIKCINNAGTPFRFSVWMLFIVAAMQTVAAQNPCGEDITTLRVRYFPFSGSLTTGAHDSRADPPNFEVNLEGSLHYRQASGETLRNRPILIFNHGHERQRGEACAIVKYFTGKGWVVFAPLRRGHILDDATRSTGIHIDLYVDLCMRSQGAAQSSGRPNFYCGSSYCRPDVPCSAPFRRNAVEVDYLNRQRIDVRDQITYVKTLQAIGTGDTTGMLVDPGRIVILGHSYGGSLITFANSYDYGQSIAVSVSGGELSWGDDEPYWEADLVAAMQDQRRPMYFLQPKNGRTLLPTRVLFAEAVKREYRSQASIFGQAPCLNDPLPDGTCDPDDGTDAKQAHITFIGRIGQLKIWGPSVIDMADRYQR